MKNIKKIGVLILIIAIIVITVGILVSIFLKNDDNNNNNNTSNDDKNLVSIKDVKVSKKTGYQHNVFSKVTSLEDFDNKMSSGSINITDLNLSFYTDYSTCGGNINFKDNNVFKNWIFDTKCSDEESSVVDLDFNVLDTATSNIEIVGAKKVKQGYVVIASENNEEAAKSYVILVNNKLEVIWKSSVQDSVDTTLKTELYDILEVNDSYYILGYASNVVNGDFIGITDASNEFAFLAKYNSSGNRESIIPIGVSKIYEFLGYHNGKLYGLGHEDVVSVKENEVETLKLSDDDILIFGMTDKFYYGYSSEEITYVDGTKNHGAKIQILNLDGTVYSSKSIKDIKQCSIHSPCSITTITGNNDNLLVTVNDQLYIMDYDMNIEKQVDYSKIKLNEKVVDTLKFDEVIMLDNSYVVISNPTTPHVMIEKYDFNHKLLDRKTYYFEYVQLLYGLSEEFSWAYSDDELYRIYTFVEPRNNLVTWSIK